MSLPNIIQQINSKLPLSGGIMTGNLAISSMYCNKMSSSTTWGVGTTWNDAPSISLYGPNETSSGIPNCFSIRAGANTYALTGKPDGNLYWGGNNVITSAGGNFNGAIHFKNGGYISRSFSNENTSGASELAISALSNVNDPYTGASIYLHDINDTRGNTQGGFFIYARNTKAKECGLCGYTDGTLTWNNRPVLSIVYEAGGIITYSNGLTFQWGSSYGSTTVNFPQPFAGGPIVYTTNNTVSDTSCNATTYVTGITPTYFTTYKIRGNSGNQVQDGGQFSWFAMGYR